ncbi:MAG: TlpA disulfide reductase family protein [Planctomycetota bacterium]
MQRIMTMRDCFFATAGVRRTPGEVTTGVFSRQASVGRRLLPLLACLTLVITGCGEAESTATQNESKTIAQSREINKQIRGGSEPIERTIPVADAAALTALREQAAEEGKVLVIDCWATWCGSCVAMFPHLHKAMKERGDGVMLVSLTFDEDEELTRKAGEFLTKQDAWDGALQAAEGDARDEVPKALSDTWDGGALPAVFVYKPDGTTAYEMLETRGEVKDWVDGIAAAVDEALSE